MEKEKFINKYNFLLSLIGIVNGLYLLGYNNMFSEINIVSIVIQLVLPFVFVVYLLFLYFSTKVDKKIYLIWLVLILILVLCLGYAKFF